MYQQDGIRRFSETSKSPRAQISPNTISSTAQTSPTFQQLLRGEASSWSPTSSPKLKMNHDPEEHIIIHHNKKSALAKVREKVKKLRHTLSGKKHHDEHDLRGTPSWGVSLDEEDDEDDAEYLGAPMYESEMAPENYKHTAKEHPREVHVVPSEKHVVMSSTVEQRKEDLPSPNKTITETMTEKQGPAYAAASETVSEAYSAVSDATHNIASKITGLTVSTIPEGTETGVHSTTSSGINKLPDRSSEVGENSSRCSPRTWDKGVSVKEYLMQKFEPGEDERALSQVISETISPRMKIQTPGDMGIVGKMREAVSSFLWTDQEPSPNTTTTTKTTANSSVNIPIALSNENPASPILISTTKSSSSPNVPVSTTNATKIPISNNVHQVVEEENHGRILQAN